MCRFEIKDTIIFAWPFLTILGLIVWGIIDAWTQTQLALGGLIVFLGLFFGYMAFFFNVWESKILCSHCPFYVID